MAQQPNITALAAPAGARNNAAFTGSTTAPPYFVYAAAALPDGQPIQGNVFGNPGGWDLLKKIVAGQGFSPAVPLPYVWALFPNDTTATSSWDLGQFYGLKGLYQFGNGVNTVVNWTGTSAAVTYFPSDVEDLTITIGSDCTIANYPPAINLRGQTVIDASASTTTIEVPDVLLINMYDAAQFIGGSTPLFKAVSGGVINVTLNDTANLVNVAQIFAIDSPVALSQVNFFVNAAINPSIPSIVQNATALGSDVNLSNATIYTRVPAVASLTGLEACCIGGIGEGLNAVAIGGTTLAGVQTQAGAGSIALGSGVNGTRGSNFVAGENTFALWTGEESFSGAGHFVTAGDAKRGRVCVLGTTPGSAPGESVELLCDAGSSGTTGQYLQLSPTTSYVLEVMCIVDASATTSGLSQTFVQAYNVSANASSVPTITADPSNRQFGPVGGSTWTLTATVGTSPDRVKFTFATGATTSQCAVNCRIDFAEASTVI